VEEDHHPDIRIYGYCFVEIEHFTYRIKGLHENDFVLASKTDDISTEG
jgi:pterin-4a-carbinolamine dehydratase